MCIRDSVVISHEIDKICEYIDAICVIEKDIVFYENKMDYPCLLYTSDAADERSSVDLGGRRIIKKKKMHEEIGHTENSKTTQT